MHNITITSADVLIEKIEACEQDSGNIYRGHANALWSLIPSIFRPEGVAKLDTEFPISGDVISNDWFFDERVKECVYSWAKIRYGRHLPHAIIRIFNLYIYLIKYNYSLHKYYEVYPHRVHSDERIRAAMRPSSYWARKDTFIHFIENVFPRLIEIRHLNGDLIRSAIPDEDLAALDETFPQHYDLYTAALDWSYNPYKALYFALQNNDATCFSLYVYKQSVHSENPVEVIQSNNQDNIRARLQEGCFTYFRRPCSFYLEHGEFPSLDYYSRQIANQNLQEFFSVTKFNVNRTDQLISDLNHTLQRKGIFAESLGL